MTPDCCPAQPRRRRTRAWLLALVLAGAVCAFAAPPAAAQEHAAPAAHDAAANAEEHAPEGILPTIARLFNFGLLAGVLVYFLKSPLSAYLASRSSQIRQDLITAAEVRAAATTQLAEIEQKLKSLPAELDALTARGAEDLKAEQARIAHAAAAERERLIAQARREIEMRLRVARSALTEHAAQLAVGLAEDRIRRTITPDDQLRLVDRYTAQLKEAR